MNNVMEPDSLMVFVDDIALTGVQAFALEVVPGCVRGVIIDILRTDGRFLYDTFNPELHMIRICYRQEDETVSVLYTLKNVVFLSESLGVGADDIVIERSAVFVGELV